jgi:LacI family transcriptional regulator
MVDIRELARRSGVSAATVSRALNDRAEVSPQTRARILELAAELGYSPSQPARTLVRKRSDTIGLIWDTGYERDGSRHPFLQDLLVALKRPLSDAGYHLMLLATAESEAAVDTYLRAARQHSLDGVILMGVDEGHPAITAVVEAAVPSVAVDLPLRGPRTTYVSSDNRTGAATAISHLYALGRRRIAIINGPVSMMPASERLAGYRYQSALLGLEYRPEYVAHGDFFLASGYDATRALLALREPPDAIFAAGDEMAIGAMHAIFDAGLSVPRDIAVVGFDDIETASLVRPALTTIAQAPKDLCTSAVDALLTIIGEGDNEVPAVPQPRILPTRLVVRSSCGASADRGDQRDGGSG